MLGDATVYGPDVVDVESSEAAERPAERYAVLIAGEADSSSFYNNLSFVHDLLVEKGYKEENIVVLYDDGKDPQTFQEMRTYGEPKGGSPERPSLARSGANDLYVFTPRASPIVDGPATRGAIAKAFEDLASKCREGDEVFVYVSDHGGRKGDESTIVVKDPNADPDSWWGGYDEITESEFARMVDPLRSRSQIMVFDQCHSGGFAQRFGTNGRVAVSACEPEESSYISHPMDGFPDAFFSAIRGRDWSGNEVKADLNGDGKVSIKEAYQYSLEHDPFANGQHEYYSEHPLLVAEGLDPDKAFIGG